MLCNKVVSLNLSVVGKDTEKGNFWRGRYPCMQRRIVHLANPRANLRNKICMHRSFHVFRPKVNRNLMPRGENRVKIPRTGMYKINTPFGANKKYV